MSRLHFWGLISFVIILVIGAFGDLSQALAEEKEAGWARASKYRISLGTEDELLIEVNVWGQVVKPGQYVVPSTTDLVTLLSYAGGPTENANLNDVRIVRVGQKNPQIISVSIKKYMETGDAALIPTVNPGDTVVVPASVFHMFSRFVNFVSQVAIIANVYYLLFKR
ncbi:MAG TPA: hypothetical protein EYP53_03880 [Candidatus Latescibacteria bacterium]|nr:hypothetical protein [Candidatus Latescibacterota bacterium]